MKYWHTDWPYVKTLVKATRIKVIWQKFEESCNPLAICDEMHSLHHYKKNYFQCG